MNPPDPAQQTRSILTRTLVFTLLSCLAIGVTGIAWIRHLEGRSALALLEMARKVHPQASLEEVQSVLGPPTYTFEAPDFPPWLKASAIGHETEGTVLVYTNKHLPPYLLLIHLTPSTGVKFVTWEPT